MTDDFSTIPVGYKQTEVGVIPVDWEVEKIGNIAQVIGGGTPSTQVPIYWGGEIDWFTPTEVGSNKYLSESRRKLTDLGLQKSSALMLPKGAILLTSRAGIGDLGILKSPACTNQGFQSLVCNSRVNNEFLYYVMLTKRNELERKASGSTFLEISPSELKSVLIALPSFDEQWQIGKALSDADCQIRALENLIVKKRDIKLGTMQKLLLGKTRLQGFNGEWNIKELKQILQYEQPQKYIVKNTEYNELYEIPVLTANNAFILGYTFEDVNQFVNVPAIIFDDFTLNSKYVDFPFKLKSSAIKILQIKDGSSNLRFIYERMQLINHSIGEHKRYYLSEYQYTKIQVPESKEQDAIAEVLTDMNAEIVTLEQRLRKAKAIKEGMMQQLLTGRIRLIDSNSQGEASI